MWCALSLSLSLCAPTTKLRHHSSTVAPASTRRRVRAELVPSRLGACDSGIEISRSRSLLCLLRCSIARALVPTLLVSEHRRRTTCAECRGRPSCRRRFACLRGCGGCVCGEGARTGEEDRSRPRARSWALAADLRTTARPGSRRSLHVSVPCVVS